MTHPYPIHPFCQHYPRGTDQSIRDLADDLKTAGQLDAIELWRDPDGVLWVVDGKRRQEALTLAKLEPRYVEVDLPDLAAILEHIRAKNHRRDLTPTERAVIAAQQIGVYQAAAGARMQAGTLASPDARGRAEDQAGAAMSVSGSSVRRALAVAEHGIPELQDAAAEIGLQTAAHIARLPAEEQLKAVQRANRGARERAQKDGRKEALRQIRRLIGRAEKLVGKLDPGEGEAVATHLHAALAEIDRLE